MAMFEEEIDSLAFMLARNASISLTKPIVETAITMVKPSWKSFFMDGFRLSKDLVSSVPIPSILSHRTNLEKAFIAGGLCYAVLQCNRFGLIDKLHAVTNVVVPGYAEIMSFFGRRLRVEVDPHSYTNRNSFESRRDGSDERRMTTPSYQCKIGFKKEGKFYVIGCAVRFEENCLVGPDHVLSDEDLDEKFAFGRQGLVSLKGKERIMLATDLVMIKLTDKEFSSIGVTICKIVPVPERGAMAQIVGPDSMGTCGRIISDDINFGRVIYEGTTLAGYSGSSYSIGSGCAGVHQLGGKINGGLDASYIWMLIRSYLGFHYEESEDWLLGQFKAGKKLRWNPHGDPDYVQVHVGGIYSTVQKISMKKAFGKDWDSSEYVYSINKRTYSDGVKQGRMIPESSPLDSSLGEDQDSMCLGASSMLENSQELHQRILQNAISAYIQLSPKKQIAFRKQMMLSKKPPTISGQVSQEPLPSMQVN